MARKVDAWNTSPLRTSSYSGNYSGRENASDYNVWVEGYELPDRSCSR